MLGKQPLLFNTFHYMALWYDFREIKFYCTNYILFMNIKDKKGNYLSKLWLSFLGPLI
jgi:hypothetical protein